MVECVDEWIEIGRKKNERAKKKITEMLIVCAFSSGSHPSQQGPRAVPYP